MTQRTLVFDKEKAKQDEVKPGGLRASSSFSLPLLLLQVDDDLRLPLVSSRCISFSAAKSLLQESDDGVQVGGGLDFGLGQAAWRRGCSRHCVTWIYPGSTPASRR